MVNSSDLQLKRIKGQVIRLSDIAFFIGLWCFAFYFGERSMLWAAGLLLSTIGFGFWMTARFQLGKSFTIKAEARNLVTNGLYRHFRHPIYLFGALATFGALVALQNWLILGIWLLYVAPIQWSRLRQEEAVLENAFGMAYLEHRSKTWI